MPQPTQTHSPEYEVHYASPPSHDSSDYMHHALVLSRPPHNNTAQPPRVPAQTPTTTRHEGIKVLHDCDSAVLDICFVHGLAGNMLDTWTAENHQEPWPKTLLPTAFPRARILAFGYDADGIRGKPASLARLNDHSKTLLFDLVMERARSGTTGRPLIFVAHSLGGLVCKEAILASQTDQNIRQRDVFKSLKGIIFLGTPHRGAWLENAAGVPATGLGFFPSVNGDILEVLKPQNQLLDTIRIRFANMLSDLERNERRSIEIACFFESIPMGANGQPVVSKDSATFDRYQCLPVSANHIDMAKFSSSEDAGFRRLVFVLEGWNLTPGEGTQ